MANNPKINKSLFSAAVSLLNAGEYNQAINILDGLIEAEPDLIESYVLKGVIQQKNNNFDIAETFI